MEKEVLATALLLQLSVSDILFRFNPHAHKTFSLENDQTTALWLIKRKSTWINQVIDLLKLKDDFWRIYPLERLSAGKTIGGTNDRREVCGPWQLFPAYCNNNNALLVVNVHSTTIYCGT